MSEDVGVLARPAAGRTAAVGAVIRDYLNLTKPGIMFLVLITTAAAMWLASGGRPPVGLLLLTVFGTALSSASAAVLNCWFDRDIDALMERTRRRPLPDGRIRPGAALAFGIVLGVASVILLASTVNVLSALLAVVAILFYFLVYTVWLKRRTPQNIVIGGAAGAIPPMIGWAAVTGQVSWEAVVLFLVIFLWTPPHFWALALYRHGDYERAGVPMLPVVCGEDATRRQIFLYSVALVPVTLTLYAGGAGRLYLVAAAALGAVFLYLAYRVFRFRAHSRPLFFYSILYLTVLCLVIVVDRDVFGGP
ncbi:MAG: protoheme IX farnesyltransferase [Clostridia bacterium]|nr:protoheme IX farnesyltransferase [Clostridia bacterium]